MRPRAAPSLVSRHSPASEAVVAKLAALASLTMAEREAVSGLCWNARRIDARRDIIAEGDRPAGLYVILDGWACRYKVLRGGSRHLSALLMPGDFCDSSPSMTERMDHGLAAITTVMVACIDPGRFSAVLREHPAIALATQRSAEVDLATVRTWLIGLGGLSAIARVAHLLCELRDRSHRVGHGEGQSFAFPLTQSELAEVTGQTAVHANRVIRELRDLGVASVMGGCATIFDGHRLEQIADYDPRYLRLPQSVDA